MRTNIDIDDKLMKQAMKATGAATKKAAVEESLFLAVGCSRGGKVERAIVRQFSMCVGTTTTGLHPTRKSSACGDSRKESPLRMSAQERHE